MPSISGNGLRGMAAIAFAIGSSATSVFAAEPFGVAARDIYIVQLADPPAAALNPGAKVDTEAPATQVYVAKLLAAQSAVAAAAGLANKIYSYTYTVNGFAIELTAQQAAKLARAPGVIAVTKDEIQQIDTATTPAFLGLTGPGGFYARTGGVKGENVIIGVLDTGIWPDHPSLSPAGFGPPPAKWKGSCQTGTGFTAANCNNKLLGARYFNAGFGGDAGVLDKLPYEYTSPKDAVGHGTHTLTTAGGNEGVVIPTSAALAALRTASGIAPRARVAAYKVCWGRPAQSPGVAGCKTVDAVAAIEQAVVDGVDVINFSIGGSRSSVVDPLQAAFRSAASAGVFVAVSAGNSGQAPTGETPILQTVAHLSPWVTTVAASTHNRETSATLTLGNGASYTGAALAPIAVPPGTAMILGSDAAAAGKGVIEAGYCFASFNPGGLALDRAKVAGKIVVCEHSPIQPYFSPSFAVWEAGGIGMVLINTAAAPLHDDPHRVPWVHLEHTDRTAVRDYAGGANPTASISAATVSPSTGVAPVIADFSSRGPNLNVALHWDQLKPDLTAPGVNILAGTSPDGDFGQLFWQKDGTSMASPHVAGLAALFKQAHPTWSPMAIKSALMTTAIDLVGMSNSAPLTLWSQGAGHVRPAAALYPALVYDSGPRDWDGWLCGQGLISLPTCPIFTMDTSDLNTPSIAIGDIPGSQTVRRRVTNVSGNPQTFTASVTGMDGFAVAVNPARFTLGAGVTREFSVNFTRTTAPVYASKPDLYAAFRAGQLTWSNGLTAVRIPMIVQAIADTATAPLLVQGSGGFMRYPMNVGYTGPFSVTTRGLVPSIEHSNAIATGGVATFRVTIPVDTIYASFSMFDSDVPAGSDFAIAVKAPGGAPIRSSERVVGSREEVNLIAPPPGVYTLEVRAVSVPGVAPFKAHSFILGETSANNLAAYAPFMVTAGQSIKISLVPIPYLLPYGKRYMGAIVYGGNAGLPDPTLVRIDR